MPERITAPYGSWKSPITADLIVAGSVPLGSPQWDGADLYWIESRPAEGGRSVLMRRREDGTFQEVTPAPFNVRTRVHEYGGGAALIAGEVAYFSNFSDNRLYRCTPGEQPRPITPEGPCRYADFRLDAARNRLIAVREDHSQPDREAVNTLVAISLDRSGAQAVLVSGNDFYSTPRLSPDGSRLCWLTWNHPNMPWDGTELWTASIAADGSLEDTQLIAGGESESIFQPSWSPSGELFFVSDRTGWWNLYRQGEDGAEALAPAEAEFGAPQWVFGMSTYDFSSEGRVICAVASGGITRLMTLHVTSGALTPVDSPYTYFSTVAANGETIATVAASPTMPAALVEIDTAGGKTTVVKTSISVDVDPTYISVPREIEFPTEGGRTAHAFFYPPQNPDYQAPASELPPLIVHSHGGPTGFSPAVLDLNDQFWTSRGFALLDVNYGGSTGYGRQYRERLNGQWGVVDVDDCVNGALYLARQGLVDPNRLIIVGGSAGGYTTLAALTFRDTFHAGASYFGIGDLEPFVADTHKFESRYMDRLIGPYPERQDLYRERSPVNYTDRLSRPIILFQGLDDKVVPPNQAELMAEALRNKGIPFAYVAYEGEGHGFRRAENIKRTLEGELYFYSRIFGFDLPQGVETVEIENLPSAAGAG